jgi:tetratricopeptide (TPR) repeat protein
MTEVSNEFLKKAGKVFTQLTNVAIFLRENGFAEKAIECLLVLASGDPTYETGTYAYEMGLCYEALAKFDEAAKYFAIALEQNPAISEFRIAAQRHGLPLPPDA